MNFIKSMIGGSYMIAQQSRVPLLMAPEEVEIRDIETQLGKTRVFWLRPHLKNEKPPLVLLHGWAAGAGCFFRNVKGLAPERSVLMIDLPGFAESDRPEFSDQPEEDWVKALAEVFDAEIDDKFWLAGHSFGGYLAARICLEENTRISGLILMDAWGFKEMDTTFEERLGRLKLWQRCLYHVFKPLNLTGLDALRVVPTSVGASLIKWARKDLKSTYGDEFLDYICDINSRGPASGERAFANINAGFGYAKNPMEPRLIKLAHRLPSDVHFLYGGRSWVESTPGFHIQSVLETITSTNCTVSVVEGATHHLMCTHPTEVNDIINTIINK